MKPLVALIAVVAAAIVVAAPASSSRPATTSPGYNFTIDVIITDSDVVLSRSLAKRGWLAHFVIRNRGKKAHSFEVGGLRTKGKILPGNKAKLGAYLDNRGQYPYKVDNKLRGYFVVN